MKELESLLTRQVCGEFFMHLTEQEENAIEKFAELIVRECVDSLYERIKLLEQRIIDLQGHDDLSYIDKKLSEQEEVERLRAKKKQIYEDLKDAVEAKLKEKNGE
jgi:ABC-type phosphate transport system auxiliary subunit